MARPLRRSSVIVDRRYVRLSALNDRSLVAVATCSVAKMRRSLAMTGNDPAVLASARASSTMRGRSCASQRSQRFRHRRNCLHLRGQGEVRCEREDRKQTGNVLDLIRSRNHLRIASIAGEKELRSKIIIINPHTHTGHTHTHSKAKAAAYTQAGTALFIFACTQTHTGGLP